MIYLVCVWQCQRETLFLHPLHHFRDLRPTKHGIRTIQLLTYHFQPQWKVGECEQTHLKQSPFLSALFSPFFIVQVQIEYALQAVASGAPSVGIKVVIKLKDFVLSPVLTAPLKLRKTESSCLKEIPLQMLPMGMWGPENMKIKKFRWGLFDF